MIFRRAGVFREWRRNYSLEVALGTKEIYIGIAKKFVQVFLRSYRRTQTNFLAKPIHTYICIHIYTHTYTHTHPITWLWEIRDKMLIHY